MAYTILHLSRNNQRTHLIVDDVTTLPVMFATIYGMNELSKKSLGTQENILCSLRFFYVYYYKKHKQTFDYDFYRSPSVRIVVTPIENTNDKMGTDRETNFTRT